MSEAAPTTEPATRLLRTPPAEATFFHTRILRCTLAVDDSYAYWRRVDPDASAAVSARVAFEARWFGMKSEARVRTLVTDMAERFHAFPEALALLHALETVPSHLRPLICHVHTQLADVIYRRFTGELLPTLRAQGVTGIDRRTAGDWVDGLAPGRWALTSSVKFGANLLSTAFEAGLVGGRRDPRALKLVTVPDVMLGYVLYLLRGVSFEGTLTDNPYLRSLGVTAASFGSYAPRIPGIRYAELGGTAELVFTEPDLRTWGLAYLGGGA